MSKNGLETVLKTRILRKGPCSVPFFHNACLYDKNFGYYMNRPVLGSQGDFVTAPEISSLLGEIWGALLLYYWKEWGAPAAVNLVELGPGRGCLMAAILRVGRLDASFLRSLHIMFCELNPHLRAEQEKRLKPYQSAVGSLRWFSFEELCKKLQPQAKRLSFVVANEFFDVFPCTPFVKREDGWHERLITLDTHGAFILADGPLLSTPPIHHHADYPSDSVYEKPQAASDACERLLDSLQGEALLLFADYGYTAPNPKAPGFKGDSWQALYQKKPCSPLENPGAADLTFHVNFQALCLLAQKSGFEVNLKTQRDFLLIFGLQQRAAQILGKIKEASHRERFKICIDRLISPAHMGTLFKVMMAKRKYSA